MLLDIKHIKFKNFFSFGAKWQEFTLKDGISLIVGKNVDLNISNAAGKSALMDAVVFGLFGKTVKEVNQAKIINWKNKKACEVYITFNLGNIEYRIERGLKPNFLRLYKDGKEVDQVSHKTEFQNEIEENILGIDYDTFISLIHCNPNTNVSIFTAGKAQKRQLIETLFGLSTYSEINKKSTEKLSLIESSIKEINNTIQLNERYMSDTKVQYENLCHDTFHNPPDNSDKLKELKNSLNCFIENTSLLKELKAKLESRDKSKYVDLCKQRNVLVEQISEYKDEFVDTKLISKINSIITSLNKDLKNFEEPTKCFGISLLKEKLIKLNEQITNKTKHIEEIKKEKDNLVNEINIVKSELKHLPSVDKLEDGCECPTCLSIVDVSSIENSIKERTENIQKRVSDLQEKKSLIDIEKEITELAILEAAKEKLSIQITKEKLNKKNKALEKLKILISKFEVDLENSEKRKNLVNNLKLLESQIELEKQNLINQKNNIEAQIKAEEIRIINEKNTLEEKIKSEEKSQEFYKEARKKLAEFKVKTLNKIEEYNNENKEHEKKICILKHDKDYYEFIKNLCKDENVKQYAISNIIPYINQRANYYLSEAGFNFYLKIDSFLDVEIKGPGITGATFGNLSGGESKSVSLALQFALLDVCKIKSNIFPNILILDEILDSAIDAQVIEKMMTIIKTKQLTDKIKVFIVSHRKEINSIEADSIFQVVKTNGYSNVEEIK